MGLFFCGRLLCCINMNMLTLEILSGMHGQSQLAQTEKEIVLSLLKWPCAISSRYVSLCHTGCYFLAACTHDRKHFQCFSSLSFWTGVYSPNSFGQGGTKTGRFGYTMSSGLKYLLLLLCFDGNRSISKISDSLPGRVNERIGEEREAAFPLNCQADYAQSFGML